MPNSILKEGKILIIDDERANVRFLEIVLQQAGYHNVFSTQDPRRALHLCSELKPDLLLLDLHMPHLDGFALMQILQAQPNFRSVPILVLTADGTIPIRHRALAEGAKDFLIKPLDELEVLLRIHNLLETSFRNELLEAKVQEAQRFMLSTFDTLTSPLAVLDQEGKILTANRAWRQFSDTNGGNISSCGIGANYLSACERMSGGEADQAWAVARGIRQVMSGETAEFHLEYLCHGPEEQRWFTVRVTPFVGEGPVRVVVAHENITELKRVEGELERALSAAIGAGYSPESEGYDTMYTPEPLEEAVFENVREFTTLESLPERESAAHSAANTLEASEAPYRYLFEVNPNPLWIYDCETLRFLLVNEAAIKHYGYSRDEFLAMTIKDIRPAEDVPLLLKSLLTKAQNSARRTVWRHRKKSGEIIDVEAIAHDFRLQGKTARLSLINDITEHRRIERALQQSEQEQRQLAEHLEKERERLAEAQAIAKVGSWDLNLTTNVLFWSEETYRIFGMDRSEFGVSYEAFLESVHPDDRAAVHKAYTESVANHTPYAIDHRMQMEDGSIKIVHERCKTEYDATGRPIRSVGTVQDITELRQTKQTLHHIMEGAHCLLWQAEVEDTGEERLQWTLQIASEQAAQQFLPLHVTSERTYADAWYLSRPMEDRERTDSYAAQEIRAGRSYQQEFRSQSEDGALHWLLENVRVETLGEGKWRCIGVCTDITERQLIEEERSRS